MAGTNSNAPARPEEPSALVLLVDGLIDRLQRMPLMRRAPAQCSAEEQLALAQTLGDLVSLRAIRTALEGLPPLRLDHVVTHWPELGGLLAATRRVSSSVRTRPRDGQPAATGGSILFDTLPLNGESGETMVAEELASALSAGEVSEISVPPQADLSHLLLEALTIEGRALNTTQMLAWLQERGVTPSREDVTNTLYRHEELFRKRGAGHWLPAGKDNA